MFVLGVGTGRCGTVSLSSVFNSQHDTSSSHESIISPWEFNEGFLSKNIGMLLHRQYISKVASEVAFYLLPYCQRIIEMYPETKVVCFKRDMKETATSYMKKTVGRNHWTLPSKKPEYGDWRDDPTWDSCYPKYDLPKFEAIIQYWNDYYTYSETLQAKFPDNFRIFDMKSTLQSEAAQLKMLSFCGFKIMKPIIGIKLNSIIT